MRLTTLTLLVGCSPTYLAPEAAQADLEAGCGPGTACNPIAVAGFPFTHRGDTRTGAEDVIDAYSCASTTSESGNEVWYAVQVPSPGRLRVSHPEASGDSVDVDVHILSAPNANACLARGHVDASAEVQAGTVYVVVDTWAGRDGRAMAGTYDVTIDLDLMPTGACAMVEQDLAMTWSSCDSSMENCFRSGSTTYLSLPARGPVVKEAHLVTTEDGISGWPTSSRDRLSQHYATSQSVSGYVTNRTEPWAPSGEGGSQWGQGSTGVKIPADAEAWYINMYWKSRPAGGTPMIVRNPANGRAVVAAAGYETGPGDNGSLAGVAEEVHDWLGTGHLDELEVGFAVDRSLPFGPITCTGGSNPPPPPPPPPPSGTSGTACYLGADRAGTTCAATAPLPAGTQGYGVPASADARFAPPAAFLDLTQLDADWRVAPNFVLSELADESGSRYAVLQPHAVARLQRLRDQVGAINVVDGYLNAARLAGSPSSRHQWGDAFDLDPVSVSVSRLADACRAEGAGYVEAYTNHVHCDWRDGALDPAFFGATTSSARVRRVVDVDVRWDGDALVADVLTGFDEAEGEPLREWTAFDEAGRVLVRAEGETFAPPAGTGTVEVFVGGQHAARLDL